MKKLSRKQKLLVAFTAIALLVLGGAFIWIYKDSQTAKITDLGSSMKYIGRKDSGCFPFPFSFLCVERPSSDYYYATTMTTEQIKSYFKAAKYVDSPGDGGGAGAGYTSKNLHFVREADQKEFKVTYYDNTQVVARSNGLKVSDNEIVVSLSDVDLAIAKGSLGN